MLTTLYLNIVPTKTGAFIQSWDWFVNSCLVEFCALRFQPPPNSCFHVAISKSVARRWWSLRAGKRWKSLGARSGLYGGCSKIAQLESCKICCRSATSFTIHCPNSTGFKVWTPFRHTLTTRHFFPVNID